MRRPRALSKPAAPSDKPLRHIQRQKEIGLTEAHIQQTVTQFLEADGWRAIRTEHAIERNDSGGFKRRVGEVGMPDYLYVRYDLRNIDPSQGYGSSVGAGIHNDGNPDGSWAQEVELLWIEFKAPGEKPDAHQLAWHEQERARGALVLVVDDIDSFRQWYAQSGLQRRPS